MMAHISIKEVRDCTLQPSLPEQHVARYIGHIIPNYAYTASGTELYNFQEASQIVQSCGVEMKGSPGKVEVAYFQATYRIT